MKEILQSYFWDRIDYSAGYDECWEWTAGKTRAGYGRLKVEDKMVLAHRFSYEMNVGPIPPGQCVCHTCDNPACVRPSHLFIGTQADNNRDCREKGRRQASELAAEDVVAIRQKYATGGITQRKLGEKYGVSRQQISRIVRQLKKGA